MIQTVVHFHAIFHTHDLTPKTKYHSALKNTNFLPISYNKFMDYLSKISRKISIKILLINIAGTILSMGIIFAVSYVILINFSNQETAISNQNEVDIGIKNATSSIKNKTLQATSTATSSKKR